MFGGVPHGVRQRWSGLKTLCLHALVLWLAAENGGVA